ncbi:hypothetical protein OIO90_003186 [Microbotryomycetes sp. JL221]|nr:hypothetical protein OIO90_003186 [Microbotryomycetes sp. JL221]
MTMALTTLQRLGSSANSSPSIVVSKPRSVPTATTTDKRISESPKTTSPTLSQPCNLAQPIATSHRRSKVGMFRVGLTTDDDNSGSSATSDEPARLKSQLDKARHQRVLFVPGQMARILTSEEQERLEKEEEESLLSSSRSEGVASARPSFEETENDKRDIGGSEADWETDSEEDHSLQPKRKIKIRKQKMPLKPSEFLCDKVELASSPVSSSTTQPDAEPIVLQGFVLETTAQADRDSMSDKDQPTKNPSDIRETAVDYGQTRCAKRNLTTKGSAVLPLSKPILEASKPRAWYSAPDISTDPSTRCSSAADQHDTLTTTMPRQLDQEQSTLTFVRRPTMTRQSSLGGSFSRLYTGERQVLQDKAREARNAHEMTNGHTRVGRELVDKRQRSRHHIHSSSSTSLFGLSQLEIGHHPMTGLAAIESPSDMTSDDQGETSEAEVVADTFGTITLSRTKWMQANSTDTRHLLTAEVSVFASPGSNSATSLSRSSASSMFYSAESVSPPPSLGSPTLGTISLVGSPTNLPRATTTDGYTTPRASAAATTTTTFAPGRATFSTVSTATTTPIVSRAPSKGRLGAAPVAASDLDLTEFDDKREQDSVVAAFNRLATFNRQHAATTADQLRHNRDGPNEDAVRVGRSRKSSLVGVSSSEFATPIGYSERRLRQEALAAIGVAEADGASNGIKTSPVAKSTKSLPFKKWFGL